MGFKLVEIVGEEKFKELERRITTDACRSIILVSSQREHGSQKSTYHAPSYGNVEIVAKNSFEAMKSLSSFLSYME